MSLLDNQEAQVKVRGVWTRISIEDALRLDSAEIKRCIRLPWSNEGAQARRDGPAGLISSIFPATLVVSRYGTLLSGVASLHPDPET